VTEWGLSLLVNLLANLLARWIWAAFDWGFARLADYGRTTATRTV